MRDPNRTRDSCRARHRAPRRGGRRGASERLTMHPPVRAEGWGWAFDAAVPERRRAEDREEAPVADRRGPDRRQRTERRTGVERRSGQDRRSLMGHAREFVTRFKEPLMGIGVAAAALPLIHANTPANEAAPKAAPASENATASPEAAAAAATAAAPARDVDAEVGARWSNVERTSTVAAAVDKYGISEQLASQIYDHAKDAGVDPKMAYGLVKTESDFKNTAVSHVGARGLTQLMPGTARWLEPGTKAGDLFEPETSLKVGFKYLRQLIDRYDGNKHLALTAYNRGPGIVERVLKRGRDPDNGYAGTVLRNALHGNTGANSGTPDKAPS